MYLEKMLDGLEAPLSEFVATLEGQGELRNLSRKLFIVVVVVVTGLVVGKRDDHAIARKMSCWLARAGFLCS